MQQKKKKTGTVLCFSRVPVSDLWITDPEGGVFEDLSVCLTAGQLALALFR